MNNLRALLVSDEETPELIPALTECRVELERVLSFDQAAAYNAARVPAEKIDLVILHVPGSLKPAYRLLGILKQGRRTATIPVVVLAGRCRPSELIHGYNLGAEYVIPGGTDTAQLRFGLQLLFFCDDEDSLFSSLTRGACEQLQAEAG